MEVKPEINITRKQVKKEYLRYALLAYLFVWVFCTIVSWICMPAALLPTFGAYMLVAGIIFLMLSPCFMLAFLIYFTMHILDILEELS